MRQTEVMQALLDEQRRLQAEHDRLSDRLNYVTNLIQSVSAAKKEKGASTGRKRAVWSPDARKAASDRMKLRWAERKAQEHV